MAEPKPTPFHRDQPATSDRVNNLVEAILALVRDLTPLEKETLLKRLTEVLRPISASKAGDVLGVVIQFLPKSGPWTVDQIKQTIDDHGFGAKPKEIYNAISYLARRGHIRRVGYGQYIMHDGTAIVTPDDMGPDIRMDEAYQEQ